MAQLPARAAVDDGPLELVAARGELSFEVGDEDPEVRVVRARVHLRDEEDPQRPLAARHLEDSEAHLVRRALAPQDVTRRLRDAVPAVHALVHVVAARDPHDVARRRPEPTARACTRSASGSPSAGCRAARARAGFRGSARPGSPRRAGACGPAATWIVVGWVSRRSQVEVAPARGFAALPRQRIRRPAGTKAACGPYLLVRSKSASFRLQSFPCSPCCATQLDRGRQEHRLERRELRRCGRDREQRARAVGGAPVQQVVVDLHDDLASCRQRHAGAFGEAVAAPARRPRGDPVRIVQRVLDRAGAGACRKPGAAEAIPPEAGGARVEALRIRYLRLGDAEEDDVVDDLVALPARSVRR